MSRTHRTVRFDSSMQSSWNSRLVSPHDLVQTQKDELEEDGEFRCKYSLERQVRRVRVLCKWVDLVPAKVACAVTSLNWQRCEICGRTGAG